MAKAGDLRMSRAHVDAVRELDFQLLLGGVTAGGVSSEVPRVGSIRH